MMIKFLEDAIAEFEEKEGRYLRLANEARRQKESLILILHSQSTKKPSAELESAELVQLASLPEEEELSHLVSVEAELNQEEVDIESAELSGFLLSSAIKRVANVFRDRNIDSCSLEFVAKQSGLQSEQALQVLEKKKGILWRKSKNGNWDKISKKKIGLRSLPYDERLPNCELLTRSKSLVHLISLVFEENERKTMELEDVADYLYGDEQMYWLEEEQKKIFQVLRSGLTQTGHPKSNWKRIAKGRYVKK